MAGDPTEVASHVYKTIFENDRVRVLQVSLGADDTTVMHNHPDHVAVALSDSTFRFTTDSGETIDAGLKTGQALFVDGGDHSTENTGDSELRAILVELK